MANTRTAFSSRKSVVDALVAARRSWLTLEVARAPAMDEDDFGDFVASPAPDEPASFAAFDAFPPDTAPSAAVTEAFPPRTQENEAAWDQPAAQTMGEAERDDDDFADYEEVPAPLSNPVFPPPPPPSPPHPLRRPMTTSAISTRRPPRRRRRRPSSSERPGNVPRSETTSSPSAAPRRFSRRSTPCWRARSPKRDRP